MPTMPTGEVRDLLDYSELPLELRALLAELVRITRDLIVLVVDKNSPNEDEKALLEDAGYLFAVEQRLKL